VTVKLKKSITLSTVTPAFKYFIFYYNSNVFYYLDKPYKLVTLSYSYAGLTITNVLSYFSNVSVFGSYYNTESMTEQIYVSKVYATTAINYPIGI
jgi:hypothetical protein